jgi:hypothetical protein
VITADWAAEQPAANTIAQTDTDGRIVVSCRFKGGVPPRVTLRENRRLSALRGLRAQRPAWPEPLSNTTHIAQSVGAELDPNQRVQLPPARNAGAFRTH